MQAAAKFKKYVVLPASGFVFSDDEVGFGVRPGAAIGVEDIREILEQRVNSETLLSWQTPRLTGNEPQGGILKVLRSMEEDGPKLVSATPVAERLLRASGLRLVPLTTYRFAAHAEIRPFADPVAAAGAASRDVLRWLSGKISPGRRGDGVTVGVIDSGIDHGHPDLLDAVSGGRCTVLGEDDTAFGPSTGTMGHHGTHVAGIIAGRGRLNGVEGVAPGARLRSYRVFPKVGKELASNAAIMEAIQSAVDDECDIINLSLGGSSAKEDGMRDAINFAWESGGHLSGASRQCHRSIGNRSNRLPRARRLVPAVRSTTVREPGRRHIPGVVLQYGSSDRFRRTRSVCRFHCSGRWLRRDERNFDGGAGRRRGGCGCRLA